MPTKQYIKKINGFYVKDEDARNDIVKRVKKFETVAAMQADETLTAGEVLSTIGFYAANDGGGAAYKTRELQQSEEADGINTISLNNGLVAELIIGAEVNVKTVGVKGDGVTDDTAAIQAAIDKFQNKTIYFPNGVYLVSDSIITPANNNKAVTLNLDQYAVIKADDNFDSEEAIIRIGGKDNDDYHLYDNYAEFGIFGGTIDCNDVASGISIDYGVRASVNGVYVRRTPTIGIHIKAGANNNSSDATITDCTVTCSNNTAAIGIKIDGSDNVIERIRTFSGKYGLYFSNTAGGNHITEVHALCTSRDLENLSAAQDMCAFFFKSGGGNYNYLTRVYSDGFATAFYFDGNHNNYIRDAYVYYWKDTEDTNQHTALHFSGGMTGRVDNLHCRFPQDGTNTILKVGNVNNVLGWIRELTVHNVENLNDSNDLGYDPRFNMETQKISDDKITVSVGTLAQNNVIASEKKIDVSLQISGIEATANTNTAIATLPVGFRPPESVQVIPTIISGDRTKVLTCWITTGGGIVLSSTSDISGLTVNFKTSFKI